MGDVTGDGWAAGHRTSFRRRFPAPGEPLVEHPELRSERTALVPARSAEEE